MARLPSIGGDNGQWGQILNDFLSVEHNPDGTLKKAGDIFTALSTANAAQVDAQNAQSTASSKYAKPGSGIPESDLDGSVQAKLNGAGAQDATTNSKGVIQLTGDLGGTATSPTVPGLATKADTSNVLLKGNNFSDLNNFATARQNLGLTIGTHVQAWDAELDVWSTKTAPTGTVVGTTDSQTLANKTLTGPAITAPTGLVKGDVGLANVDNTADADKPVSVAQAAANDLRVLKSGDTMTGSLNISNNGGKSTLALTNTSPGVGITLGGDVNLYRAAANSLATDDNLSVLGGTLQLGADVSLFRNSTDELRSNDRFVLRPTPTTGGIVAGLDVDNIPTTATTRTQGASIFATISTGAEPSGYAAGVEGRVISNSTGTVPRADGMLYQVENRSSGAMTQARGVAADISNYTAGTGTIGTAIGVQVDIRKTTGAITTGYGLFINSNDAVNSWGVYQQAGAFNYFAGNIGLGVNTSANITSKLTFGAATTAAGGILFGTDTNLYRSAADMLTTDDQVKIIAGTTNTAWGLILSQGSGSGNPNSSRIFFANEGDGAAAAFAMYRSGTSSLAINSGATPSVSSGTNIVSISSAGQVQLTVNGSSGGLVIGTDTNLYRSAADTLRTDDSLSVGGGLATGGNLSTGGDLTISGQQLRLQSTYRASLLQEVNGEIIDFGTNYVQAGSANVAHPGALFRIDTRPSYSAELFTVRYQAVPNGATGYEYVALRVGTDGYTSTGSGLWLSYQSSPTTASGGVVFGSAADTNLYRSATSTLKTDSNLIVAAAGTAANSVATIDATQTLTNKRITKRVTSFVSGATPTPNAATDDLFVLTALATAATFGAPTGTPTDGQSLVIRIKDSGTARALTWNAVYRAIGTALPTTTVANKTLYLGLKYNAADTKWDCLAVSQEA